MHGRGNAGDVGVDGESVMSIGAEVISGLPVADQPAATAPTTGKPPRRRRVTARADAIQQPEAR